MPATLCPSFMAAPGALLLGRVTEHHRVALMRTPLPVTRAFLDALPGGAEAEHSFRFAGPCHQAACRHWARRACQLIEQLCEASQSPYRQSPDAAEFPTDCGIRTSCRWFRQRQEAACAICPLITRQTAQACEASQPAP